MADPKRSAEFYLRIFGGKVVPPWRTHYIQIANSWGYLFLTKVELVQQTYRAIALTSVSPPNLNEVTGVALQDKNPMALLTEVMQTTYIVTTLAIILNNKRMMPDEMEVIITR